MNIKLTLPYPPDIGITDIKSGVFAVCEVIYSNTYVAVPTKSASNKYNLLDIYSRKNQVIL